LTDANGSELI
jgi:hypothetical protein